MEKFSLFLIVCNYENIQILKSSVGILSLVLTALYFFCLPHFFVPYKLVHNKNVSFRLAESAADWFFVEDTQHVS